MASTTGPDGQSASTYQQLIDRAKAAIQVLEKKAGLLTAEALEASIKTLVDLHNAIAPDDLVVTESEPVEVAPVSSKKKPDAASTITVSDVEPSPISESTGSVALPTGSAVPVTSKKKSSVDKSV